MERLIGAAKRTGTTNEKLVTLWHDVLNDNKLDNERLKTNDNLLDLIPLKTPCCDGKDRISSKRLIQGTSSDRPWGKKYFGGFLSYVADTLLVDHANRLVKLFDISQKPTADQAADYLEWVWAQQKTVDVREDVVDAWRIIIAEPSVWLRMEKCRERGDMKLFCRQPRASDGNWLSLLSTHPYEPVWNDDPKKAACLWEIDGIWPEIWISREDINIDDVNKLLNLLGIRRLSDNNNFKLEINHGSGDLMQDETGRLCRIIKAISVHRKTREGQDDLFVTNLNLYSTNFIKRTFQIGDKEPRIEELDAILEDKDNMYVVGRKSATWATDLRPLVQQTLGLGGNARGLRLLEAVKKLNYLSCL